MDGEALVRAFEAGEEPAGGFHHAQHVHVAWWYLREHPLPEALKRFSESLRRFATAQGKPALYHETVTVAFLLIISERLADGDGDGSWDAFVARNPDLFAWKPSVLDRYLSPRDALERAGACQLRHARPAGDRPELSPSDDFEQPVYVVIADLRTPSLGPGVTSSCHRYRGR